jgi:hypothetical protein
VRSFTLARAVCVLGLMVWSVPALAALNGSAALRSQSLGAGQYRNQVTVQNTGDTTIGTLWFAWIPGQNYLPSQPTNIVSPPGWTALVTTAGAPDGYGIRWTANASSRIPVGGTLSGFGFDGSDAPAVLSGNAPNAPTTPILTSFFYIGNAFGDPGLRFVASVVPPCPVDWDGNGTRQPADIFAFLTSYFNGEARADFNANGTREPGDIFAFLTAYFVGCP